MRTVSLILRKEAHYPFYETKPFIEYVKGLNPNHIFLTVTGPSEEHPSQVLVNKMLQDAEISPKIKDVSVPFTEVVKMEDDFNKKISGEPTLIAKKKMLDMFTDTIYNYLGGTWKDFETLNSHDTRTIFKARYLLISSVIPEYVSKCCFPLLHSINERISAHNPSENDVVISDIEWSFWFRDNVKTAPE